MTTRQKGLLGIGVGLIASLAAALIMGFCAGNMRPLNLFGWTIFFAAILPWYQLFDKPGRWRCFGRRHEAA